LNITNYGLGFNHVDSDKKEPVNAESKEKAEIELVKSFQGRFNYEVLEKELAVAYRNILNPYQEQ